MELNILASKSPRRKDLLNQIGFKFSVVDSQFKEYKNNNVPPEALTETLAREKALSVAKIYPDNIIIGADTIVTIENKILGKPKDENESFEMLNLISGKSHEVITGVAFIQLSKNIDHTFNQQTIVTLSDISKREISSYIEEYKPFDKAGSYGIQDGFSLYIKKLKGCYYNVMGLPIFEFFHNYKIVFGNF